MSMSLSQIMEKLNSMEDRFEKRFAEQDKRFEEINKHLEEHDKRFEKINKHLEEHDKRFEEVNKHLKDHDKSFKEQKEQNFRFAQEFLRIDDRFKALENQIAKNQNQILERFDDLAAIFTRLDVEQASTGQEVNLLKSRVTKLEKAVFK